MQAPAVFHRLLGSAALCGALAATGAPAQAVLVNGGFESGLDGWTVADLPGSDGGFRSQSGSGSPLTASAVAAPPQGTRAAMSDAEGPGAHVLYQDFVVPAGVSTALLSFQLYVRNDAGEAFVPETLAFATPALNQQVRVDLLLPSADVFATDSLQPLYRSTPGTAGQAAYQLLSFDVAALLQAHEGQTLRLRFADTNNVALQNVGVDAVNLAVSVVPEPATAGMLALGLAGCLVPGLWRRRRAAAVAQGG